MKKNKRNKIAGLCVLLCLSAAYASQPKFVVTGEQMEIIQNGKKLVFRGNAKVKRGENTLTADEIIQVKENNFVTATGDVKFNAVNANKDLLKGSSEKADYYLTTGKGTLYGKGSELEYFASSGPAAGAGAPMKLIADKIDFDQEEKSIFAQTNVRIITSSATAVSTTAKFDDLKKILVLEGTAPRPRLNYKTAGEDGIFSSDKITMFVDEKKVVMEGNVSGTMAQRAGKKDRK
jgi:lipopolysaccharide assembly outer membrane protein LptD (OstA)